MDDFFRRNLASLSGAETKVAVALLIAPGASNAELKRLSGITGNTTFYHALKTLYGRGYSQNRSESLPIQEYHSQNRSTPLLKQESTPKIGVEHSQNRSDDSQNRSMDFETALELADAMDAEGDERRPDSPFQVRRKQQLVLLQEAWASMFEQELVPLAAKELLQTARSQSLDVYHAMQQAADRKVEYPKAYVRRILQELAKKPAHQTDLEVLRPVTEEQRQSWIENDKQLAGHLDGWHL